MPSLTNTCDVNKKQSCALSKLLILSLKYVLVSLSDAFQDPREKNGKAELRLSLDTDVAKMSLGNDNGAAWGWPFFRARRVTAPGSYTFESMRYPGAYLCTSDMKVLGMKPADWGSVKLVLVRKLASWYFHFLLGHLCTPPQVIAS